MPSLDDSFLLGLSLEAERSFLEVADVMLDDNWSTGLEDFWEEDCFDSDVFGMFFSGLFFASKWRNNL